MPENVETVEPVGIVTLMERTNDDNETFTAPEVRRIIEYVNTVAINDIYNQTRIATIMQENESRKARDKTLLAALINSMGSNAVPQLLSLLEVTNEPSQE